MGEADAVIRSGRWLPPAIRRRAALIGPRAGAPGAFAVGVLGSEYRGIVVDWLLVDGVCVCVGWGGGLGDLAVALCSSDLSTVLGLVCGALWWWVDGSLVWFAGCCWILCLLPDVRLRAYILGGVVAIGRFRCTDAFATQSDW